MKSHDGTMVFKEDTSRRSWKVARNSLISEIRGKWKISTGPGGWELGNQMSGN